MEFFAESIDRTLVVRVAEARIDAAIAIRFKDAMRTITAQPGRAVILDLSRVSFIDSSGLGAIVAVMKFLAPERSLELAGLTPTVRKVFHLTRMDKVFIIHEHPPEGSLQGTG